MAHKAGSADLPLHSGHVPKWLADRMTRLGAVISEGPEVLKVVELPEVQVPCQTAAIRAS